MCTHVQEVSVRQQNPFLLGLFALATAMMLSPAAHAVVGVTSQTNGDPTGKPPVDAERILRVGIDIQADELITTREDDRAHIVFVDGTSLTVGPNAQLKIDKFVYDPDTKAGDLAISVTSGVLRVVGGRISKTRPIQVNTPSSTIGIRGGIALFEVNARETRSQFLFGKSMVVSAHGQSQTASRPGSEIVTRFGGIPGVPGIIPTGGLASAFTSLEGRAGGKGDTTPDVRARQSGFSDQNSGQGIPPPPQTKGNGAADSSATQALTDANAQKGRILPPPVVVVVAAPPQIVPAVLSFDRDPWCRDPPGRDFRNDRHHRR